MSRWQQRTSVFEEDYAAAAVHGSKHLVRPHDRISGFVLPPAIDIAICYERSPWGIDGEPFPETRRDQVSQKARRLGFLDSLPIGEEGFPMWKWFLATSLSVQVRRFGTAPLLPLSTKRAGQRENREKSAPIHPGGPFTGSSAAHAGYSDGDPPDRNMCGMFGIAGRSRGSPMLSTKLPFQFATEGLAPRHGFEPRFTAPKAAVLPLDDRGIEMKDCSRPV